MESNLVKAQYFRDPRLLEQAYRKARSIITETRKQAAKILWAARNIRANAYKEGFAHGLRNAEKFNQLALLKETSRLNQAFLKERNQATQQLTLTLEEIVVQVCETVVGQSFENSRELTKNYISRSLLELSKNDPIKFSVNPEDFQISREALHSLNLNLTVEASDRVSSGTLQAILHSGCIELSWKDHLQQLQPNIRAALTELIKECA